MGSCNRRRSSSSHLVRSAVIRTPSSCGYFLASASNASHSASLVSFVESPPSALCFIARQTLLATRSGSPSGTAHGPYQTTRSPDHRSENSIIVTINSPTGKRWPSIVQRTKLTRCRRSREVGGCKSRPELLRHRMPIGTAVYGEAQCFDTDLALAVCSLLNAR